MKVLILSPPSRYGETINRDLIYGCWCHGKRGGSIQLPPLNLLYIATILKNSGHDVKVLDAVGEGKNVDQIKDGAKDFEVVIVSSANTTFLYDIYVIEEFKKINPELICIFCGPHPTVYPKKILEHKVIDYSVYGEYEHTLKELIGKLEKNLSLEKVKGISYRKNGEIILTPARPYIENLDDFPIPDRSFINPKIYFNPLAKKRPLATVLSSRGCLGKCIFCTSPSFYNHKFRLRSAENVLEELEYLEKQGYKEVLFRDEVFTTDRVRLEKICNGIIERKINLIWSSNSRIGTLNEDIMRLMKKAGCHYLWFGVESGSQEILDNIKKYIKVTITEKTFEMAREVGIDTHAHFMFGCPGETKETINASKELIRKIKPSTIDLGIVTPFPGTELFDMVARKTDEIENGTKINDGALFKKGDMLTKTFFNEYLCDLKREEIEKTIMEIYREFYLRPGYVLKKLLKIRTFNGFINDLKSGINTFSFIINKK